MVCLDFLEREECFFIDVIPEGEMGEDAMRGAREEQRLATVQGARKSNLKAPFAGLYALVALRKCAQAVATHRVVAVLRAKRPGREAQRAKARFDGAERNEPIFFFFRNRSSLVLPG